ncbi:hypothetical protein QUF75_20485 [Desulfococcaceae bacterium HSG7]|nr:hypothetical protein [Desulfococcaceae bacterium HSG7]
MKSKIFIGIIVIEAALLAVFYITACLSVKERQPELRVKRKLVKCLMLTDLSLWTEATYTRHPSQADFFTPFQDFPAAIEHFPSGSVVAAPPANGFASPVYGRNSVSGE